jgi:3-oxoacyl-[acyl-carrier protein] reductase
MMVSVGKDERVEGLRVIVTGSSSGLGAATAVALAQAGARIVVNYSSREKEAEQTADVCRAAGAEVIVVRGDVRHDHDCRRIASIASGWGGLDALVNNAGTTKHVPHGDLTGLSAEDFQEIYAVNTVGPFQMIRAVRPHLESSSRTSGRPSSIVNISSIAGINGLGSSIAYAASKGALNVMTQSLARALAPSIRVNAVCPGYIDTPWFEKGLGAEQAQAMRDRIKAKAILGIASGASDVAKLVAFIAGPASSHMTGELIRIDAGLHLAV